MKRTTLIIGLAALLLAGCTGEKAETEHAREAQKVAAAALPAAEEQKAPAFYEGYPASPQVTDDRLLQQPGGTIRDSRGEAELLKNGEKKQIKAGPVELTVHETKLFHYYPDYSLIDFYHAYTHETDFPVAKLFVEVTNTGAAPVNFGPVAVLETETGENKLWEDDIYLEELGGEIAPGETKKGSVGFILEDGTADHLTVRTSDVFDVKGEKLSRGEEFEIRLGDGEEE